MIRLFLLPSVIILVACAAGESVINVDGSAPGLVYDGHGALSAGASSRLLVDYDEPHRSNILDFLFKPDFGAAIQHLKIEIGGDTQSTDGTEPSHMHYRDDLNCTRGYEFFLLQEAKKRNPEILTYALSWGVPFWVGNQTGFFSQDNVDYHITWLECVRDHYDINIDYVGIWNERSCSPSWTKALRGAMDVAGFTDTQIVLPDNNALDELIKDVETDTAFAEAVTAFGVHYPCNKPRPEIINSLGKKYWSSEDYSTVADWAGAGCWGRVLSQNYVRMNQTSTIAWSLIWSVYPEWVYFGNGLMYAYEPWSGHYELNGPLWTHAHTAQFTRAGWTMLPVGSGAGMLEGGGSVVTYVEPVVSGLAAVAIVLESLEGDCLRCKGLPTEDQTVTLQLLGGLEQHRELAVWRTNETHQFVREPSTVRVDPTTGRVAVSLPRDSMCTLTSRLTGPSKGNHGPIPPSTPFPLPYSDSFDSYTPEKQARFFADNGGSFLIANSQGKSGMVLKQFVKNAAGVNGWVKDVDPISAIGAGNWSDYTVSAEVRIASTHTKEDARMETDKCDAREGQRWRVSGTLIQAYENATSHWLCLEVDTTVVDSAPLQLRECVPGRMQQQWDVRENGWIVSRFNGGCLDVHGNTPLPGTAVDTYTCVDQSNEKWKIDETQQQIRSELTQDTTLCLTAVRAPSAYAGVCARIANDAKTVGYCTVVTQEGRWEVRRGGETTTVLASGPLLGAPLDWHSVSLECVGSTMTAYVDGARVASLDDPTHTHGRASLNSGFHLALFDNFSLK